MSRSVPGPARVNVGRLGVRGRLLLAFVAISGFALIAAAAGMFSLGLVGDALERVTEERLPQALGWQALSRQAERIVHAAPTLLVVDSQDEREAVAQSIEGEVERLEQQLAMIEAASASAEGVVALRIRPMIDGLSANLIAVDGLIQERLEIAARKRDSLGRLANNTRTAQRLMAPGVLVVDSKLLEWDRKVGAAAAGLLDAEQSSLARTLISLIPQQKAEALVSLIHDQLLKIAAADSESEISVLEFPAQRALDELEAVTANLPTIIQRRLTRQIKVYRTLADGEGSLGAVRVAELEALQRAEGVLAENAEVSAELTAAVDRLVVEANRDIHDAGSEASAVQRFSAGVLISVVVLSLLCSALIAWLYVDRNLVARLTGLSNSMLAIAGGNLRAALPAARGSDEIAQMAQALTVFRDTAVEVEQNNLREIATARQRLVDAIESISEGFAFYDAEDRLILSNQRYHELLHGGSEIDLTPGTPFEAIIRQAVERSLIEDAVGDPEGWIQRRLDRHRNPGEPQLQRRSDGRWVQISERRIEGGGSVAVFSDVTELKESEQRAASANRLIMQSLRYASRIQSAVLPARDALSWAAKDHFLIWEPRDVVGGDFFWFQPAEGGYVVIVGDCTGHGVPGAFMTLIACGMLDRIWQSTPPDQPSRVLSELHRGLQMLLGQDQGEGETDDGLEAGVCFVSEAERRLVFSGARFSLWRANGGGVDEIKGDRAGIGYRRFGHDTRFTDVPVDLANGAAFYLTTDGLIDQVGGPRHRSFGKRRFRAFVAEHQGRPMPEQAEALRQTLGAYQGDQARRDDVTVLGFAPDPA